MEGDKKRVLLLEDRDSWAQVAIEDFEGRVEVLRARNCAEAYEIFSRSGGEIDGMYIDALIQGESDVPDDYTYEFVSDVRSEGYEGHMVTASSEDFMNDRLVRAGCDIRSSKTYAATDLLKALGL